MRLLKYIIQKRRPITIAAVICMLLFYIYGFLNTFYSSSMVVSFIYPSSEKGQYPDSTRLNIYDFLSDEVLENAVDLYNEEKGTQLESSDIKKHIVVDEYVSPMLQEKVQSARSSGEDYFYFANEFTITCGMMSKADAFDFVHLFGLIPNIDSKLMAEKLYESYSDFFMNSHTEMNIIPRLATEIDYSNYDYLETASVFENKINMYIDYLEAKNSENGSFVSKTTGMTFNDLIVELKNLKNLKVENLKGFISASKIAKDTEAYINMLRAENENLELQYQKTLGEAEISRAAMNAYDHTFEENIVITGMNDEIGLYQARPKTAYDAITKRALKYGVQATSLLKDIEENNRLIQMYSTAQITPEETQRLHGVIDSMIKEIELSCGTLTDNANKTVEDFLNEKSSDYLRRSVNSKSYISLSIIIRCLIVLIFAAAAAVAGCLFYDVFKKQYSAVIRNINENRTKSKQLKRLAGIERGQRVSDLSEQDNANKEESTK